MQFKKSSNYTFVPLLSISLWPHSKKDLRPYFHYVAVIILGLLTHKNNLRLCLHWLYLFCTWSPDTFTLLGCGKAPCSLLWYSFFFLCMGNWTYFHLEKVTCCMWHCVLYVVSLASGYYWSREYPGVRGWGVRSSSPRTGLHHLDSAAVTSADHGSLAIRFGSHSFL